MLQISTLDNIVIPYHHKVISKYKNKLNSISPDLINSEPILSGSFAINLVYSPFSEYRDIDFYFATEENYKKAFILLSKIETPTSTDNADTFLNLNCQLIKKYFIPPEELIYKHDFVNASVAIHNNNIYTSLDTFKAWSKDELIIRSFQLEGLEINKQKIASKITQILSRIEKYLHRYELSLSLASLEILKDLKDYIIKNLIHDEEIINLKLCKDYYNNDITMKDSLNSWLVTLDQFINQKNESYLNENNMPFF